MITVAQYRRTLDRIPDDIVLSMASREIEPNEGPSCICGWAVRESIARVCGIDASEAPTPSRIIYECWNRFGGTEPEWASVYWHIIGDTTAALVEEAFADRVMAAAGVQP